MSKPIAMQELIKIRDDFIESNIPPLYTPEIIVAYALGLLLKKDIIKKESDNDK